MVKRKILSGVWAVLFIFSMLITSHLGFGAVAYAANNQVDIYKPDLSFWDPGVTYPRIIQLRNSGSANGTLLATCELYGGTPLPAFPIFKSTDEGKTWTCISYVEDKQNGWGMRWEPMLYELPQALGSLPAGTLLCVGLSIDNSHTYGKIDLYRSNDQGVTWTFMSHITSGGGSGDGIWEPHLLINSSGNLVCYYADERGVPGQKIVHQVSTDGGYTWGVVVNDTAPTDTNLRPGMPVVSKLPNGSYFMTYEVVGISGNPVHFKTSNDGVNWNPSSIGTKLTSVDGVTPGSSPFNVWTPAGGPNGMVIVSGMFQTPSSTRGSDYYVNYNLGQGSWYRMQQPLSYTYSSSAMFGYSHSMFVSSSGNELYHISTINYQDLKGKLTFEKTPITFTPGYAFKLVNKKSNLCLAIGGASTADGASAIQWGDSFGNEQKWYIVDAGGGYYKIFNINSGKVLSIGSAATGDGGLAIQWGDYTGNEQLWKIELQSDGFYKITNKNSGKSLQVQGGSLTNGAKIDQWTDSGANYQRWQLQCVDTMFVPNTSYTLKAKHSGQLLTVDGGSQADAANIIQWPNLNDPAQSWKIEPCGGGYYKVINTNSNKALSVGGSYTGNGGDIIQWPYYGGNEQQWLLLYTSSGYYKLINRNSGKCLEVAGSSTQNGADIDQWTDTGANNQLWYIEKKP